MVKTKERFGLTGTEVKLKGFIDSRILYKMPLPMQNALYVYNAMKKITYNDGHTYVTTSQLCRKYWYSTRNAVVSRSLSEKEIEQAVNYLTECDVLEKDHLQSGEEVIVFPHIKEYEMSIAEAVAILMKGLPCLPKTAVYEEVCIQDKLWYSSNQDGDCNCNAMLPLFPKSGINRFFFHLLPLIMTLSFSTA